MKIPFLSKWLRKQETKEQIEEFVRLQMRKARIIALKREIEKLK